MEWINVRLFLCNYGKMAYTDLTMLDKHGRTLYIVINIHVTAYPFMVEGNQSNEGPWPLTTSQLQEKLPLVIWSQHFLDFFRFEKKNKNPSFRYWYAIRVYQKICRIHLLCLCEEHTVWLELEGYLCYEILMSYLQKYIEKKGSSRVGCVTAYVIFQTV